MMKKKLFAVFGTASVLALATACSSQKTPETTAAAVGTAVESSAETTAETETAATEETSAAAEQDSSSDTAAEGSVSGTICEIKDFMFTVETDSAAYAFSFDPENPPSDLEDVKDGDSVTVTYTGDLSEMDVFEGTIVSIKKAK